MSNAVTKIFTKNGTWTAPAGVNTVNVEAISTPQMFSFGTASPGGSTTGEVSFFLDSFQNLYSMGLNNQSQLGANGTTSVSSPILVSSTLRFSQLTTSPNGNDCWAIATNGRLYAWGANSLGETGTGNLASSPVATPTLVTAQYTFQQVAMFWGQTGTTQGALMLTTQGQLFAAGQGTHGELGTGNLTAQSVCTAVAGNLLFSKVHAANDQGNAIQSCFAITTAGALYGWGQNGSGQLGLGDLNPRSSPVAVLGALVFQDVRSSNQSTLALTTTGVLYGWGGNINGQLASGNQNSFSSPNAAIGGLTFVAIDMRVSSSGSGTTAYGLTAAGVLYAWGGNANGQLGVGDTNPRSSPVAVLGGLTIAQFSVNGVSAYAITTAGVLYAWGLNTSGQLGTNDVNPRSSPVAVLGGLVFASIGCSNVSQSGTTTNWAMGMTTSGALYSWGYNSKGALGLGDTVPRSSPVAVLGGLFVNNIPWAPDYTISVVPGQTYAITLQQPIAFFGTTAISNAQNGPVTSVVLEYNQ